DLSNLSRDEVDVMLGINLEQTRVYREAKAEGELIGEARGEARGEAKEQALILRLLTRRVGKMPNQLQERIKSLPLERLEELGEALLDFTAMADLEAWLAR
ncbi:DUF4351 domain-containing protein, partial [Chamaesiphon sp. GL140_3_metabinner_50]|uniref:DUF4351 domain-containing protein n=1 Tax=Chamaesiphon sp. GL140_3_metabinner_50 TaxID=2970812 RepID=UPI0025D02591